MSASLSDGFVAALLDPGAGLPAGVLGDARRLAIYRGNVLVSLVEALRGRFSVTAELVGDDFFRALARAYALAHLPRSPLLMVYGDDFPTFIENFEAARELPYLADVARLEAAWSQAYHAAEAVPMTPAALSALPVERLPGATATLHPSLRLLRSRDPVVAIWSSHRAGGTFPQAGTWQAEDAMILRPDSEVLVRRLPSGALPCVAALLAGATLGDAAAAGLADAPAFDPGGCLLGLVRSGALVTITLQEPST